MVDRTTKALLFAIALGLWLGLVSDWLRPTPVQAELASPQVRIADTLDEIAKGWCKNKKLCGP